MPSGFFHQSQTGESTQLEHEHLQQPIGSHPNQLTSIGPFNTIQGTVYYLVVLDSDLTGKVLTQRSQFYRNNICCTLTILKL